MQQAAMRTLMRAENNNIALDRSVFTRENFRRIGQFARPHTRRIVFFLVLSVFGATLAVATPLLAGRVVTAIVEASPVRVVIGLALAIAAIGIIEAIVAVVTRLWSARIGEGLILDLRRAVFDHVQTMPVAFFMRTRTGALVSRLNNDVMGAQRAFSDTLSGVVSNLVQLVLTLAVMAGINWQLTVLSVLLLPIFLFPARYVGKRLARLRREASDLNASMNDQMTERFNAGGATLVKLFGRPETESAEFSARAGRVRGIGVRTALLMSVFMNSLTLVSTLALALVYGLGGWFALNGALDAGSVVALALLLTRLYGPLTSLANAPMDIVTAIVSFERVFEVLDLEPLISDAPDAVAIPEGPATIEFDDVTFSYPSADKVSLASLEEVAVLDTRGGQEVLHGISFRAEPGQMIALVGSSGAGKSTIASLLPRLYDVDSGAVRVSGLDVRRVTSSSLRRTVGMVTQDGHLFHDTIRSNLTFARPEVSDDLVWDALRRARLEDLVRSLPDGLDTVIGDRGYRLSGGERQRLTIARLLIAAPSVVVLDEATSALDSTNESAVQEALSEAMADRTSLVIAHRLSTVRAADTILVLEAGRVVESGTHAELLATGGRYAELYETQFADQE
ncbi:ABC transporter [Dietzia alimentaria]|jgi:ABC-type multidrug transport system fused ATPase/permease subunit|uniref:ABC transporter ATP-binding protein n=1 Tax=Dietzia TaxID=37914 RepID=UPI000804EC27|nr:ABC transporter ATP-binding protein [Dietzia sp. SLG510A3-30A2]MBB0994337.1 ABC transporter ATP-binding protein [Dietzia sp. SLG510A3-40A3]MBB0996880.1 ABC transporter ATP-binding protein [Dietzia maris]MBB1010465.1 ABC transporter ATP-binding protein [Dietzia sp. SLG510A3-3B2-2]MBB1017472.1 ABC transporter ATP-binding protein [Dietzia sp. DQ11-71]OAV77802.1 ABC transporter [Dietzia sp. 111N12-1]ODQ83662.1 ABC transporter [Dietzia alimentaria]